MYISNTLPSLFIFTSHSVTMTASDIAPTDWLLWFANHAEGQDQNLVLQAVSNGDVACLKDYLDAGSPWDGAAMIAAATHGHLPCVKLLLSRGGTLEPKVLVAAASAGQKDMVAFLLEQQCPCTMEALRGAVKENHLRCVHTLCVARLWLREHATAIAAEYGCYAVLRALHQMGYPWDDMTPRNAAFYGHLSCLEYAHRRGCKWNGWTANAAACNGHLECLQYCLDNKCPVIAMLAFSTIAGDHVECLKCIHRHGGGWNPDWLKYAKDKGAHKWLAYAKRHSGVSKKRLQHQDRKTGIYTVGTCKMKYTAEKW